MLEKTGKIVRGAKNGTRGPSLAGLETDGVGGQKQNVYLDPGRKEKKRGKKDVAKGGGGGKK